MARPSKVDLCMFCGEAPCKCREKVKAPPKARAPRKRTTEPIAPESNTRSIPSSRSSSREKPDVTAAMRSAAKIQHKQPIVNADEISLSVDAWIADDGEMVEALRAVLPLASAHDRLRYGFVNKIPVNTKVRAAAWKKRILDEK